MGHHSSASGSFAWEAHTSAFSSGGPEEDADAPPLLLPPRRTPYEAAGGRAACETAPAHARAWKACACSAAGGPATTARPGAGAGDGVETAGGGSAEELQDPIGTFFLQPSRKQGKQRTSPRTPPHQWPQSECLLPQARRSFSAQESDGGNLFKSVPSSLEQQELAKLSQRLIFAMQGCAHQRHVPTGQTCSFACWCFWKPSHDQPQW
mmetsp:Transcript_42255/g.120878  ORF Transcript_42255/g.120878 Transcript_42255/m.120878 type:complete len:208 (-) Transcript_42255:400-1023(-)